MISLRFKKQISRPPRKCSSTKDCKTEKSFSEFLFPTISNSKGFYTKIRPQTTTLPKNTADKKRKHKQPFAKKTYECRRE